MRTAYLVGSSCTAFGKFPERSFQDLTREAYLEVLTDAGLADGALARNRSRAASWHASSG